MRSALTALLILVAAAALGACGSDTPPEDEVREAAIVAGKSEDPKQFCRELVTARFVEEVFDGDLAACLKSDIVDENPGKPVVTQVAIPENDDSRATVAMTFKGGESGGLSGHLLFVEQDDGWKLDRFETDYLRSVFDVSIDKVDEGVVSTPEMKACMGRQLDRQGDAFLRALTFDSLTDKKRAEAKTIGLAEACPGPLADAVADEITAGLIESGERGPAFIRCAHDEFAAFLELLGITPDLVRGKLDFATMAALEGLTAGVRKNCAGG